MFKTFIAGILLGVAGAAAGLYFIPIVDQAREQSMIVVQPNQGSTETFHINVPSDRIMVGAPAQAEQMPAGLEWPEDLQFATTRAEVFKVRNGQEVVVGVASRIAANDEVAGEIIEWVLHLPARGSAYMAMEPEPREGGYRVGDLVTGSREFAPLVGRATVRWVESTSEFDEDMQGRIEIITAFVGRLAEDE